MLLKPNNPASVEGRTIHTKMRKSANDVKILKPASNNTKLGKRSNIITKGKWINMPMFSLTLEERATCPRTCHHWQDCYGNNMGFAHRIIHNDDFENKLKQEIDFLALKYPHGFVIRLHVLGDFYSVSYVKLWGYLLSTYPSLHIFGYTAHFIGPIKDAIHGLRCLFPSRFAIRISVGRPYEQGVQIFACKEGQVEDSILCPEQTGKTESCLTCGLCWSVNKTIAFKGH